MTRLRLFFGFTAVATMTLAALVLWADGAGRSWQADDLPRLQRLVSRLGLTDLALWTEARYTRHPSQTDLFSAFQDFPGAPEHFPAGSIVPPPPALTAPGVLGAPGSGGRPDVEHRDHRRRDVGSPRLPEDVGASTASEGAP